MTMIDPLVILAHTPHFGYSTYKKFVEFGLDFHKLIAHPSAFKAYLHPKTLAYLEQKSHQKVCQQIDAWLQSQPNHYLITLSDTAYPDAFRQLPDAPLVFFAKGNIKLLDQSHIAVVGTRQATHYGQQVTNRLVSQLTNASIGIISGMATGIDGLAHQAALNHQGSTIAVLGTGIDRVYPAKHRQLAHRIATDGLLLSEFNLGAGPTRYHFPKRNRLISALAVGVLVVESATESGSLITAKHALEQGKEVFAVPGSIFNDTSQGCHDLIQQGAKLTTSAQDIFQEMPPGLCNTAATQQIEKYNTTHLSATAQCVLNHITHQVTDLDTLISQTQLDYTTLTKTLFELELDQWIQTVPGGYQRC